MEEVSDGLNFDHLSWKRVDAGFFNGDDVLLIAGQLIGMKLVSFFDPVITSGIITETEAYAGETDRASHAYGGRRTRRTETMFRKGGLTYVYLCYGIHALFNVVTNLPGIPHAVLIRGIIPLEGLEIIQARIGRKPDLLKDGKGPGRVSRLMGIDCSCNGTDMTVSDRIWIEKSAFAFKAAHIKTTKRIGVDYGCEDALLPYRFVVDHHIAAEEIKKAGLL
ncbi:MAG: DNA-3-methyladenine glycosylase [Bacteroidota bacterium]